MCGEKCPIAVKPLLFSSLQVLVRVGSGQCQVLIRKNRERCLGDCWPLRPFEAAELGRVFLENWVIRLPENPQKVTQLFFLREWALA